MAVGTLLLSLLHLALEVIVVELEVLAVEAEAEVVLDLVNGGMVSIKLDLPIHVFKENSLVNKMMVFHKEQVSTLTNMVTFQSMSLVEMLLNPLWNLLLHLLTLIYWKTFYWLVIQHLHLFKSTLFRLSHWVVT